MTIREMAEQREVAYFSPYASLSSKSRGRDREEPPCDIRPVYQRDRDRILHSKAFRRLKHKTQVFLLPQGDHYPRRGRRRRTGRELPRPDHRCDRGEGNEVPALLDALRKPRRARPLPALRRRLQGPRRCV